MTIEQIQYPIGKWVAKDYYSSKEIQQNIANLLIYTLKYRELTQHLSEEDLAKTYREGSWTIRQIVHHVADTHLWHFIRIKQALTEENPNGIFGNVIAISALPDSAKAPIEDSLQMIESTHKRYAYVCSNIPESEYNRTYYHPFRQINVTIPQAMDMTVWHVKHHFEHILIALARVIDGNIIE
ncbi:MAG: DinB family protein [Arcicella sp.]|nr:DinB family protein [Arcicella sp.]